MPRRWFRHDSSTRLDDKVRALGDQFGPVGHLCWLNLLEVRCSEDRDIIASQDELRTLLAIRSTWTLDLGAWLRKASRLGLVSVRKRRDSRLHVVVLGWPSYLPRRDSTEYARERQRRSRAEKSRPGHARVTPGSRRGHALQTEQTLQHNIKVERVTNVPDAEPVDDDAMSNPQPQPQPQPLHRLLALGVSKRAAVEVIEQFDADRITRQLDWMSRRPGILNPAGAIVKAIQEDWPEPSAEPRREYPTVEEVMKRMEAS